MANSNSHSTSKLLTAGIIAGPFFAIVAVAQGLLRPGFSMVRHPASMLSLGDLGWIQIANFVLTGIFFIICGIGLRQQLTTGIGSTWAPRLFTLLWAGTILGFGWTSLVIAKVKQEQEVASTAYLSIA